MLITAYADMQAVIDAVNRGQVSALLRQAVGRARSCSRALEDALRICALQMRLREVEGRMLQSERLAAWAR